MIIIQQVNTLHEVYTHDDLPNHSGHLQRGFQHVKLEGWQRKKELLGHCMEPL